jgi:hypothetical protein
MSIGGDGSAAKTAAVAIAARAAIESLLKARFIEGS